ncbi:hypothetical protein AW736_26460 [Termitidicoccus mucosus]|uniref:Uncharacterized protein n=1 Tax=Termitidicoccus mucosus TaxID=1184151 RepID=A0A178IRQ7_9BACT|nr:hypothetical protein AW736_26460 [Opitutaceae bacterium TSB47]
MRGDGLRAAFQGAFRVPRARAALAGACALSVLFAAGCASAKKPVEVKPEATPTRIVFMEPPSEQPPVLPAEYEEYYVGMLQSPTNPEMAYLPGKAYVQTKPARFNRAATNVAPTDGTPRPQTLFSRGPVQTSRSADYHPEPTDTEVSIYFANAQRTLAGLVETNDRLQKRVAELEKAQEDIEDARANQAATALASTPAGTAAFGARLQNPAAAAASEDFDMPSDAGLTIIRPNSEYVIELDPNFFNLPRSSSNNPFEQIYQPPVTLHEATLVVSGIVTGGRPGAILNNQPYLIGEHFKGLTLHRVDADTAYLRKDRFLLACPVSKRELRLRIP